MRRIYRRVCVLRAIGHDREAGELERSELSPALDSARAASPAVADAEAALFAEEANRVTEARLLAELIAPLLTEGLRPMLSATPAAVAASALRPPLAPPRAAPSPAAGVPSVADLIEGMLAQDRALAAPRSR